MIWMDRRHRARSSICAGVHTCNNLITWRHGTVCSMMDLEYDRRWYAFCVCWYPWWSPNEMKIVDGMITCIEEWRWYNRTSSNWSDGMAGSLLESDRAAEGWRWICQEANVILIGRVVIVIWHEAYRREEWSRHGVTANVTKPKSDCNLCRKLRP